MLLYPLLERPPVTGGRRPSPCSHAKQTPVADWRRIIFEPISHQCIGCFIYVWCPLNLHSMWEPGCAQLAVFCLKTEGIAVMAELQMHGTPLQYHHLDSHRDMDLMGHPAAGKDWDALRSPGPAKACPGQFN
jgi:hypothetical protein